ncbi:response regulator transcription factor [bacterium]|nr:response regulator transcription factor [bacterium]
MDVESKLSAIIVDDSSLFRAHLTVALENRGFDIIGKAVNGVAGAAMILRLKPTLAILDYEMPIWDGLTAIQAVRAKNNQTRIFVVSATINEERLKSLLAAGADAILTKPIDLGKLEDAIFQYVLSPPVPRRSVAS